jgi:serine/threonine protein kinase/tetratricopeptide (TPR) repeat protein
MGEKERLSQCAKCFTLNPEDSKFCSKCGSALEGAWETLSYPGEEVPSDEDSRFTPGEIFAKRYRIVEEIGRGGMGRVYKAEDTELNITVALKIIRPKYSADPIFIERFKKEILTARSISHENVIRIYDLGEAEKTKYISMEYIKGQNLREFIQTSGSLSIETAINLIRQIGEALKAAHHKGIIHQDLKPSNIMIDNKGQAYIMDFGLARSLYIREEGTEGGISGTPPYMSPEQARNEKIDQTSDIYSFGIIMYEILTGKPLFKATTTREYIQMHTAEIPKAPSRVNPHIPCLLENVVLKCLEKDKNKRYQSTEEILLDLRKIKVEPEPFSLGNWVKKRWYVPVSAGLLLFIVMSVSLWIRVPRSPRLREGRISLVIPYLMNNTGDENLDYLGKTFCELLVADLLQSQHIRVVTGDRLYDILKKLDLLGVSNYSSDDLRKVAILGSVDYILQGNITKAGELIRVSTSLHKADNLEPVGAEKVEGKGLESIFSMVDGLSREIKEDFNLSAATIAKDIDKDVETITTNSPDALKHYVEGKLLFQERKHQESIKALEKAISSDPEFALAYVKISENYYYLGNIDQGDKYLTKALALLNKVSEREYYLIQAYAAYSPQLELENYEKLLEIYPDDIDGNSYLAAIYRNMEEWDLALEKFEKIIEVSPKDPLSYENLAYIYMAKGLYDKARKILLANQNLFTNPAFFHLSLGTSYLCENKYDLALDQASKARSLEPDNLETNELVGQIYQIRGDFEPAEETYRQMIERDDLLSQYMGRLWLSHLYLMRGEYERSENELELGLEHARQVKFKPGLFNFKILNVYIDLQRNLIPPALDSAIEALEAANEVGYLDYKNSAFYFRGLVDVKRKKFEEARETAEKLKLQIEESGRKKLMRYYHLLMGEIAMEQGDIRQGIDYFETACFLLSWEHIKTDIHILFLDRLASAYFQIGDLVRARNEYEKIVRLSTGRLRWGDKYARSFYWMGKIYQQQGNGKKAVENYRKFLEIWSHADRGLFELEDAKKQFAALEETSPKE